MKVKEVSSSESQVINTPTLTLPEAVKKFGFVGEGGIIEFENLANGFYGSVMDSSIKIGTIKP
ncbi:MAG: hypothetical protein Q7V48_05235, partial [Deltaproteobacteria bacterium]|nr:hypothetical protein [Deltaproteobacteria bacterium]